jgi:hypothetical protein
MRFRIITRKNTEQKKVERLFVLTGTTTTPGSFLSFSVRAFPDTTPGSCLVLNPDRDLFTGKISPFQAPIV